MRITIEIDGKRLRAFTVAAILLGVIGVPFLALAGNVTLPHTFVNGQIADANDVNANFSALANVVNVHGADIGNLSGLQTVSQTSLVAAINEVRHGAEFIMPAAGDVVAGLVTVPADGQGFGEIRPPPGEVWSLHQVANNGLPVGAFYTDGSLEVLAGTLTIGKVTVSNSIWVRLRSSQSVPAHAAHFVGSRSRLPLVGKLATVPDGATVEVRPPPGEVWFIRHMSDFPSIGIHPQVTDGTNSLITDNMNPGSSPLLAGIPIDNGRWIRFVNSTGQSKDVFATGTKAP